MIHRVMAIRSGSGVNFFGVEKIEFCVAINLVFFFMVWNHTRLEAILRNALGKRNRKTHVLN